MGPGRFPRDPLPGTAEIMRQKGRSGGASI